MYASLHHDEAFVKLKALLEPFEITHFYSDGWGAYERHLDTAIHLIGKRNTQLYWTQTFNSTHSD